MCSSVMKKISTGSSCIDGKLNGGISAGTVTLVYGEPETGKSTMAMQCAINCATQGYKTLFVDCDNTFSARRLSQIAAAKFAEIADHIILVKPTDFKLERGEEMSHAIDVVPQLSIRIMPAPR